MIRPRLRSILILINLVILILPLGGIGVLRIYESALVRQTESELIAQGVIIAAAYRASFNRLAGKADVLGYGVPRTAPDHPLKPGEPWRPRQAQLDLANDPIYPPPPEALPATNAPDTLAKNAGSELAAIIREAQYVTLAGIRVVDRHGTVVASTGEDRGKSLANHEEIQRALTGEYVSILRQRVSDAPQPKLDSISRGTRIRVFAAIPILRDDRVLGAVLLVRTPNNIKAAIWGKREALTQGGLILAAVVVLLSLFSALMISLPVRALIHQARRAARGEQGAITPLKFAGTREIAELSETIGSMAQALEERANYIRDFAAHVSHEFKTPLTAIQGSIELLRDHDTGMSAEERARFLGMIDADAKRLEQLVRRLLELARADVMKVGGERAEIAAVLTATAARYQERGLNVQLPTTALYMLVMMAPETLDSIVSNLLDNARQHAGAQAIVRLNWSPDERSAEPMACIDISDNGHGISEANMQRIFQPFFTTARKTGNTGLGLAIVKSLLAAHRGDIALLPSKQGASFRIRLPLSSHVV